MHKEKRKKEKDQETKKCIHNINLHTCIPQLDLGGGGKYLRSSLGSGLYESRPYILGGGDLGGLVSLSYAAP
jgi:hypothetical protein